VAITLHNLARLYHHQARYTEAEPLYRRCLAIEEKTIGPEHRRVATTLNNLAELLGSTNRVQEADTLRDRANRIRSR
jgi:tetratricopeptide (TPR) repeat protein